MRTKFLQAICVLVLFLLVFPGCTSQKKAGCVPEKSKVKNIKFKGFL